MTVWKPFKLSTAARAHVPPFLLYAALDARSYTIHLTDLTNIWSESLDRRAIIHRSQEEGTSIDPSDDDQFRILVEKIRLGLEGQKGTTSALTITADDDRPTIILNLTVPLPGGLAPLQWPIRLSASPPSTFMSQLTIPMLRAQHARMQEVEGLGEVLEAKDHVIQRLLDKLEQQGTELGQIFPQLAGKAGRKIDRKQAEERVRGLGKFDMETWKKTLDSEKSQEVSQLIAEVFGGGGTRGVSAEAGATQDEAAESWWETIKGITVNLNTGRISTNGIEKQSPLQRRSSPKPTLRKESSIEDKAFQVQGTPTRLASRAVKASLPEPAKIDSSTDTEDDDLGGPSQLSRIPDSFPKPRSQSQSQHRQPPSPSPPAPSPKKAQKLGKIGSKKAVSKSSPPPDEAASTTDDSAPSPPPKQKSPSATPEPALKPKPKAKLGRIGGKKAAPPPEPEPRPEPEPEPGPATPVKPKAKLGRIGGKRKVNAPAPDFPDPKIKSSPHSTQEEVAASNTVEDDRARAAVKEEEEKQKTPEPEETSIEKADRIRAETKRKLEEKAKQPVKKKPRKF